MTAFHRLRSWGRWIVRRQRLERALDDDLRDYLEHSADAKIPKTRDCRYFIGVSVLKRIEPLADRCPLVRSIGN